RHDPDVLRDAYAADAKAKLIARMRGATRVERHELFKRTHAVLDEYRRNHARDLADLDANASESKGQVADAAIAGDRTWAFPLFPAEMLGGLRSSIDAEFGVSR